MSDPMEALSTMRLRFTSGNSVPVERTQITRAEWYDLWLAFDDAAETMELEGLHSSEGYQKLKRLVGLMEMQE